MSIKPNYSWWIVLGLVAVGAMLGGSGCALNTLDPAYVRTSGTAYTWADVPRYDGRVVYFNRYGKPMIRRYGVWYYVPSSALGYQRYRVYVSRVRLCRSSSRNPYWAKYCRRSAFARRAYVRNRYGSRSRYYRSYPRRYRTTYRSTRYRSSGTRRYTTRRYGSSTSRRYGSSSTTRRKPARTRSYGYYGSGRRYDSSGRYRGRMDKNGRMYDSSGRYRGRVDKSGRRYDSSGRYRGRVDKSGRRYDSSGRYKGRIDKNGRMYDASGRYKGRVDKNGRMYDASGRYKGRVR